MSQKPLADVRVLDATRMVSGPLACHFLAALGAQVIRVERPGGDPTWNTPPFVGPSGVHPGPRGPDDIGLAPLRRARGKQSVVIDVNRPRGREVFLDLVGWADVLVENFRPGTMDGLGLSRATLTARNETLIHCSITGYGQHGPYRDRPAMDLVVQATSGLMAKTGFADGPPIKSGVMIGDQVPAIFAALATISALRLRDRDGQGRFIDLSLFDSLLNLLWDEPLDHYEDTGMAPRSGNSDHRAGPIGTFETVDGQFVMVLTSEKQWVGLCHTIGRDDLVHHSRASRRGEARDTINAAIASWCAKLTMQKVMTALDACGIPAGPVQPPWIARRDPHVIARGSLVPLVHGGSGNATGYLGTTLPFQISGVDLSTSPAEILGASTDTILAEICGLSADEISRLRHEGTIG